MASSPGDSLKSAAALRALCIALHGRLSEVAANACSAREELAALCRAAKAEVEPGTAETTTDVLGLVDAHFDEISADVDRAEALKTARLEAELVIADEALAALFDDSDAASELGGSDPGHALTPIEPATLRIVPLRDRVLSDGYVRLCAVCAPRGLEAGDLCLRTVDPKCIPDCSAALEIGISEAYESRGPGEVDSALEAAADVLTTHGHLETSQDGLPCRIDLVGRLFVDSLRSCIVVSFGIPDRALSSDAVIISDVQYRGATLQAATLEFPVRFPVLPADVKLMWETRCLQFGPWRLARCDPRHPAFAPSSRTSLCLTIWNDAAPQSADWVVVELVLSSNGWFRFERGPKRSIHWGARGSEATRQSISSTWELPLRPARLSAQSLDAVLRAPESSLGTVRFLGIGINGSFSISLIGGVACTFLPDGTVSFGHVEMQEADVAGWSLERVGREPEVPLQTC